MDDYPVISVMPSIKSKNSKNKVKKGTPFSNLLKQTQRKHAKLRGI
jgi:hypothetical protein